MSKVEKCLFRQNIELQPEQASGYFKFIENNDPDKVFIIEKTYCTYTYSHNESSRALPLEPISFTISDEPGTEIVYNRLSEWNNGVTSYEDLPPLATDGYLSISNPNVANGCSLKATIFVEGTFKEPSSDEKPSIVRIQTIEAVPIVEDDSWGAYIRRQQERRKKSIGESTKPSRLPAWLTSSLLGLCISASFIPTSYFELLLCLAVL